MGRISLRTYNNEIEKLIEQESFEEAIAHCRHILSIFPKHVDTYRLLGKAYLESHKHTEALDIFQRLLSAVPDDFIAHLAMSIIREEEGDWDAAIGHMTYAFEIQPYNSAIQDEMRRLYARRDGAAPAKIRLTHGALVRMYARGHLYEQALAEVRQVLANTPRRADMQLLLAQIYEKLNRPVQAAEVCSLLLKKLPYCLEANRILANIITVSKGKEEAKIYYTHLDALDPYRAFLNPQAPTLSDIPDQAVQLEKLVYQPGGLVPTAQEDTWLASIGEDKSALALSQEEKLPDWLTGETGEGGESPAEQTPPQTVETSEDVIPDWMKAAGWRPDSGTFDEAAASKSLLVEDVDEGEGAAAPAELPDWLQEIAPPEVVTGSLNVPPDEAAVEEDETLAALIDTGSLNYTPKESAEAAPAEELPDWFSELGAEEAAPAAEISVEAAAPGEGEAVVPAQPEARSIPSFEESPAGILTPPPASEEVPLPPPPEWVLEGEAPQEEATTTPISWDKDGQASIEKMDLNQASLVQLERLPGIGFRLAQAIVTYRDAHGPFTSLDDLEAVAGIGPMTIAELRNFLYVMPPSEKKHRRPPTGMPLPDAQSALEAGTPEEAVRILQPVIRNGGALDEVIHLLRRALHKYPDSFELWQALGDACVRADRLDEALEAYDQAEQILVQIT